MFLISTFLYASIIGASSAKAQASSGEVQFDLIFPKNETYAPTAWFPVVYAIRGSWIAKSLQLEFDGSLRRSNLGYGNLSEADWYDMTAFGIPLLPGWQGIPAPEDPFFFIATVTNMTNRTDDHTPFILEWSTSLDNCSVYRRLAEEDPEGDRWSSGPQVLEFSIGPRGKVPDIAEAVARCGYQSSAVYADKSGDSCY
ncbi:unnamed protein product [Parascedosporium putredinis]|uniref:DUF7136 domain-containing protein n=1 Tax=Parascedosporium putredinis TaxID=1442378 RepID=A0A9P1MF77_9PEZI|nr:unnamed protein product [Parascedosporium putredinis]CAI8004408.1 unnamed protein product [Parascedosporium putredinis]